MPADPRDLTRGHICLAVFPFAPSFPVRLADGRELANVEQWARTVRGAPGHLISEARLRPVLLLHDRTRPEHGDAVCLRINTVKSHLRANESLWARIERQEHPFFFFLSAAVERYRLPEDSVVAVGSIGSVHRSAILAPTGGALTSREMQLVSERLARLIELDLAPRIAKLARELLVRGGYVRD